MLPLNKKQLITLKALYLDWGQCYIPENFVFYGCRTKDYSDLRTLNALERRRLIQYGQGPKCTLRVTHQGVTFLEANYYV